MKSRNKLNILICIYLNIKVFMTAAYCYFRLLLGNADGHLGNDPSAVPCILQRIDKDGSVLKGPPGYMVS